MGIEDVTFQVRLQSSLLLKEFSGTAVRCA